MPLTKKRWLVLAASCFINLCIGSLYAWSVFALPLAARLGAIAGVTLTASDLSIVFTIANAVGPITMISGGWFNDKFGPRWVIFAGGLLFGGGMILSGLAQSVGALVATYGLGLGLGMGLVYGCTVSNSVKFFPDKRGLIGGIAVATYGLSSVIIPPIAGAMLNGVGVESTLFVLGIAFLVIVCGCAFLVQRCPVGFVPEGWSPPTEKGQTAVVEMNWKGMLRTPVFYVMLLMLMAGAFSGLMTVSQASPVAQKMVGLPVEAATLVVSVLALFNAAGRIIGGHISDRLGAVNTLSGVFCLSVAGLLMLFFSGEGTDVLFYIAICIIGFCFGSFMGIFPGFTARQFGSRNNSVNYGIMFVGFAIAGTLGPMLMGQIYATTGQYQPAFLLAAGLAVLGLILSVVYRVVIKRHKT